jgi:hypothetical protein
MVKNKSIEDLLGSIYELVQEAKKEYEDIILNNNAKSLDNHQFATKNDIKELKENITQKPNASFSKKKDENNLKNWKTIDFKIKDCSLNKKIAEPNTLKSDNQLGSIEKEFTKEMEIWSKKKVKRIIEREFSNFIKFS